MNNFNQRGKFAGEGKKRFEGRDTRKVTEMHNATCAGCSKACQVPFKPNGMKPVFCKDCFEKNGGQVTKREFGPKPYSPNARSFAPDSRAFSAPEKNNEQTKLLEALNQKLDKLISIAEGLSAPKEKPKSRKVSKK